jgi:hypothetical protein
MATSEQIPGASEVQSAPQTRPSGVRQQYQPPEGAISIARLKRVGIGLGLLVLGYPTGQDLRMVPDLVQYTTAPGNRTVRRLVEYPSAPVDSHRIHSGRLESALFSEALSASHGAAAARLLFSFTLDPLAGSTQVYRIVSVTCRFGSTGVYR